MHYIFCIFSTHRKTYIHNIVGMEDVPGPYPHVLQARHRVAEHAAVAQEAVSQYTQENRLDAGEDLTDAEHARRVALAESHAAMRAETAKRIALATSVMAAATATSSNGACIQATSQTHNLQQQQEEQDESEAVMMTREKGSSEDAAHIQADRIERTQSDSASVSHSPAHCQRSDDDSSIGASPHHVCDCKDARAANTDRASCRPTYCLFTAACDGDVNALRCALDQGADINACGQPDPRQYHGTTMTRRWDFSAPPLVFAAAFGRVRAVRALLQWGADPARRSSTQCSARDYAKARGYSEIVEMLPCEGVEQSKEPP